MLFLVCLVLVILYGIFLLWMRTGLNRMETAASTNGYRVSVIIAARNEERNLPRLLDALCSQTYPPELFEVVVVDDGSTDGTLAVIQSYADKLPELVVVHNEEIPEGWAPKKWALTQAVEASRGEIILATDADCLPGPDWIGTIVLPFADKRVGLVAGPAPLESPKRSLWNEMLFLDSCGMDAFGAAGMGHGLALTCTGRNMAYRKQAFEQVDGYVDLERITLGDDDMLMYKIITRGYWKAAFSLHPGARVTSPPPATFASFIKQRLRYGSSGHHYYSVAAPSYLLALLPFLLLVNLAGVISLVGFVSTVSWLWLLPLALKIAVEGHLVGSYLKKIAKPLRFLPFLLTGILYPLYIIVFGILGNFIKVTWKGRQPPDQAAEGSPHSPM